MNSKKRRDSYGPQNVEYLAETMVDVDICEFTWTLSSFSTLGSQPIHSPRFQGGPKTNCTWELYETPKTRIDGDQNEYLGIFLNHPEVSVEGQSGKNAPKKTLAVSFQFSLLHPDDTPGKEGPTTYMKFTSSRRKSSCSNFITMDEILNESNSLVVNDTVRIYCKIWIEGKRKHTIRSCGIVSDTSSMKDTNANGIRTLGSDLKMGLKLECFSDVNLVTSTKTFKAHKFMLAARSRVFHVMFTSGMLESSENSVQITDFDENIVQAMLEYIYCGGTSALAEKASDLLRIAEKYELTDLRSDCEEFLGNNLQIETAAEVLILAHLHDAPKLKSKLITYINSNKEKMNKTEGFNLVQKYPTLLMELYLSQK